MAPEELPEDVALWPRDMNELFDLPSVYGRDDLKRAYTRLIRRFRPEHHPDAFRRIREVYELLQRFQGEEAPAFLAMPAFAVTGSAAQSLEQSPVEKTVDYWQRAMDGQWVEAFAGLKRVAPTSEGMPVHFAQLYWLASLFPELADELVPFEWLKEGIRRFGWVQPLNELVRRELLATPQTATGDGYFELRAVSWRGAGCPPWHEYRIRALVNTGNFLVLEHDFDALGSPEISLDDRTIFAILIRMYDLAAWSTVEMPRLDGELLPAILKRLNEFPMDRERDPQIERCEAALMVRKAMRAVLQSNVPIPGLFRILGQFWTEGYIGDIPEFLEYLSGVDRRPFPHLELLDRVAAIAPALIALLRTALEGENYRRDDGSEIRVSGWLIGQIRRLHGKLVSKSNWDRSEEEYEAFRLGLVNLCLRERIAFDWIIYVLRECDPFAKLNGRGLTEMLDNDLPARCICLVYRMAGAM